MLDIGQFCIKGDWDLAPTPEGQHEIKLMPSYTFGEGGHSTTKRFLAELPLLITSGLNVIDVGTGTGILAIAAARLGASAVIALDTGLEAITTAKKNVAVNGMAGIIRLHHGPLEAKGSQVQVILQNTDVPKTVVDNIPIMANVLTPGGLCALMPRRDDAPDVERLAESNDMILVARAPVGAMWEYMLFRRR